MVDIVQPVSLYVVLLVHGDRGARSSRLYRPSRALVHFVAPDLRGYSLSGKPLSGNYDVATLAADMRRLVAALGEQNAAVVSHDRDGVIACVFAIRYPDSPRPLGIIHALPPAAMLRARRRPRQLLHSSYIGFCQLRGLTERTIRRCDYALSPDRADYLGAAGWSHGRDCGAYLASASEPEHAAYSAYAGHVGTYGRKAARVSPARECRAR